MESDAVGTPFISDVVLHMGAQSYEPEPNIHVLPLDQLWS